MNTKIGNITRSERGITFAVDEVAPATKPLDLCKAHEAVRAMLEGDIESCCDYHGDVVKGINYQPLLAAVYLAFSEHRPLVLSPDSVWITIAQGVAHHMAIHGERLRERFVSHSGKLNLVFTAQGWVAGTPENPWHEAFDGWTGKIRDHVGASVYDTLVCDFSTTGPVERAASQVVMMDIFQRYFHFVLLCICGIPCVTLEGSTDDWQKLADKARGLRVFDMDWWLDHLLPICDQFVAASKGEVDLKHWQGICKLREEYGGHIINGWVAKLFPYVREFANGPCRQRNPIFETGEGITTWDAPPGLSRVPFTWIEGLTGKSRAMEAIGGLVGVMQDSQTLALRPKVGWAIRQADKLAVLLDRLKNEGHALRPGIDLTKTPEDYLPPDLCAFYHQSDGADLFGGRFRIAPRSEIQSLDWQEPANISGSRGPDDRTWHRFVTLDDGGFLAINLDLNRHDPRPSDSKNWRSDRTFAPICRCHPKTLGKSGENPVVAYSFAELLERILNSGENWFWRKPDFEPYGDAEQFTRRN